MNTKENKIKSYDTILDERYGAVGTPERENFRKEAYAYYMGQVIREARREEKIVRIRQADWCQQKLHIKSRKRTHRSNHFNHIQHYYCPGTEN